MLGRQPAAIVHDRFLIPLRTLLCKFDVPIGPVEELLPGGIPVVGKFNVDDGIAPRLYGMSDQPNARLGRRSTTFRNVAAVTRTEDVLPGRRAALRTRNDVIQAQFDCGESFAAILTPIAVTCENIPAVELHLLPGQLRICQDANDPWDY